MLPSAGLLEIDVMSGYGLDSLTPSFSPLGFGVCQALQRSVCLCENLLLVLARTLVNPVRFVVFGAIRDIFITQDNALLY